MEKITSLNSPHIERVKALIGSRGKKNRELENAFVAEGIQTVREALTTKIAKYLMVERLYLTELGSSKLISELGPEILDKHEVILVSDQVMNAMADSESPQGIIALCSTNTFKFEDLWRITPKRIAYFWQIQDPGNAGTVIRSADAAGFDAVVFSNESVDVFNPKTVRATVGSLWHIPVITEVDITQFIREATANNVSVYALDGEGQENFDSKFVATTLDKPSAWVFGNEARGLPDLPSDVVKVSIPMKGFAESLNVASAAAIVLHSVGLSL